MKKSRSTKISVATFHQALPPPSTSYHNSALEENVNNGSTARFSSATAATPSIRNNDVVQNAINIFNSGSGIDSSKFVMTERLDDFEVSEVGTCIMYTVRIVQNIVSSNFFFFKKLLETHH